jgi:hypothetical protein
MFIAEAYWDLEWQLQQLGFDFCYDKRLYDRLEKENAASVRGHLSGAPDYQERLVRFIENHDEPRAAAVFSPEKERAAAVVMATLPGAKLYYEGQFEGRRVRLPVFLGRRAEEDKDPELEVFYHRLLQATHVPLLEAGKWKMCNLTGWSDNMSCDNLVAWTWEDGDTRLIVIVNLSNASAQGHLQLPWRNLEGHVWGLRDPLNETFYERNGSELEEQGLYVDLGAYNYHFFQLV